MRIKINVDLKVNRLVKYFVLLDLTLFAGWGLMEPIFGIFIIRKIQGATLAVVGIAAAIYFLLKSLLQLPVANYLDRHVGEKDDFIVLLSGLLLAGFSAFSFILISQVWQLYVVQIFHAIAFALYTPSWSGIFSRHLDKEKIALDWSLDSTTVGLASGVSGFSGALLAEWLGFRAVFFIAGLMSFLAIIFLTAAPDMIFPKKTAGEPEIVLKDHISK